MTGPRTTTCNTCRTDYPSRAQHCRSCCATFRSTEAGDRHRTGEHAQHSGPDRRRCRTEVEMTDNGLIRNLCGLWVLDAGRRKSTLRTGELIKPSARGTWDTRPTLPVPVSAPYAPLRGIHAGAAA